MRPFVTYPKSAAAGAICVLFTGTIWAQDGLQASFTVSPRFEYINNKGSTQEDGARLRTDLGLSLKSETHNQTLSFDLNSGLAAGTGDDGIEDPRARLAYSIENRTTRLDLSASYQDADVDDLNFAETNEDGEIFTGDGKRELTTFRIGLALGRDGPASGNLGYSYSNSEFSGAAAADNTDTTTTGLNADARLEITPVTALTFSASQTVLERDDATQSERTERAFAIGAEHIWASDTFSAALNYDSTENVAATTTKSDGIGYTLGWNRDLPNGDIGVTLSERDTINGTRRQLRFSRSYQAAKGLDLSFSLGVSKLDGQSTQPLANLSLAYEIDKSSELNVSLAQSSSINTDNAETTNTRLSIDYARRLTQLSSLTSGLSLASSDVSAGGVDQSTVEFDINHRYQLGSEWDLVSGYRYTKTSRDGTAVDRETSSVFVGMEKTFNFRF